MTLALVVSEIHQETPTVKSYRLTAQGGGDLPAFTAGAHLDIAVTLPDCTAAQRSYSIASDPGERRHYEIGVLREAAGTGGSAFMHDRVREGDVLFSTLPKNDFALAATARHHVLIAGGIGITPLLAMARALAGARTSFELHYSARQVEEMAFRPEIEAVCGRRATCYFDGGDPRRGVDLARLLAVPLAGRHVYVCGPSGMIASVRDLTRAAGWAPETVHFEIFAAAAAQTGDRPIEVVLKRSGRIVAVAPDTTILDALIAAGEDPLYDCKRGECGVCATAILDGTPLHRDYNLTEGERAAGKSMCICVSRAVTPRLVLDL
jgi:vanillate monooxygenase ferredoxin subunit